MSTSMWLNVASYVFVFVTADPYYVLYAVFVHVTVLVASCVHVFFPISYHLKFAIHVSLGLQAVSYTHLTLPTNREV